MAVYGTLALEMGVSVAVGTLIGYFFDEHFHTAPTFTLIGFALGLLGGVFSFFKLWKMLQAKIELNEPDRENRTGRGSPEA